MHRPRAALFAAVTLAFVCLSSPLNAWAGRGVVTIGPRTGHYATPTGDADQFMVVAKHNPQYAASTGAVVARNSRGYLAVLHAAGGFTVLTRIIFGAFTGFVEQ